MIPNESFVICCGEPGERMPKKSVYLDDDKTSTSFRAVRYFAVTEFPTVWTYTP
jgi:hypothetical protein